MASGQLLRALAGHENRGMCSSQVQWNAAKLGPFLPDLRIRRQHSSESMSSINSAASHSSMGSLGKEAEDKKKKKKSWVSERKTCKN